MQTQSRLRAGDEGFVDAGLAFAGRGAALRIDWQEHDVARRHD